MWTSVIHVFFKHESKKGIEKMVVDKEAILPHTTTEFQLAVASLERMARWK